MGAIATTATITVDLQHPEINTIHAKQFDSLSRYADIKLLSGGQPWAAESSITYVIQYAKPDGTKGMYNKLPDGTTDAVTAETDASGCTVLRTRFAPQMMTVAGHVRFSIAMVQTNGTKLQTFSAILEVEPSEVNSYTSEDYYKVTSLDELLDKISKCVTSVNNVLPQDGKLLLTDLDIEASVLELGYIGTIHGALSAIAGNLGAPVARASSADGIAYTATGDGLPTVQTGSDDTHTSHVGKGRQIVFIPDVQNASNAPTLRLNGGEIIPIRLRAPQNQGSNDQSPDATLPVSVGALMRGVPYTLTFCGKYWLVDSQIPQFDQYNENILNRYASALIGLSDGDTLGVPIINSTDGLYDDIATMYVQRSAEENRNPDEDGDVIVPTVRRVDEMIRKDVTADYTAWVPESGTVKTVENYAKTLEDGNYSLYGSIYADIVTVGDVQWRIMRDYGEFLYFSIYMGDSLVFSVDTETMQAHIAERTVLTDGYIPLPTAADVGKVLTASATGRAAWTAVTNAEEVAV